MADEGQGAEGGGNTGSSGEAGVVKMTQAEFNAKLAEHKRGLQRELSEAKSKATAFETLQSQVSELLGSGLIDGVEDLAGFREKAGQTLESFKTEQQKLQEETTKTKKQLEKEVQRANEATQRYTTAMIARAITDEASPKSVSPGATELIQMKLAPLSSVAEDGTVTVKMVVKDEDGKSVVKQVGVKEAVELLEADVTNYGTLFKSTVNGGAGGNVVDGVKRGIDGTVDFSKLSFDKFLELQRKSPEVIDRALAGIDPSRPH